MATKTKAGQLELAVKFNLDAETLARVLAYVSTRDEDGSYASPPWARTRSSVERGVRGLLFKEGHDFFKETGGWSAEIFADEVDRAVAAGRAIVARFFSEL